MEGEPNDTGQSAASILQCLSSPGKGSGMSMDLMKALQGGAGDVKAGDTPTVTSAAGGSQSPAAQVRLGNILRICGIPRIPRNLNAYFDRYISQLSTEL